MRCKTTIHNTGRLPRVPLVFGSHSAQSSVARMHTISPKLRQIAMNKLWNCSKAYRLLYDTISSTKSCGLPISQSTRLTAAVPSFAVASRHIGQHSSPLSHLLVRTPASTTALCRGLFAPHIPASVSLWLLARRSVSTSTNIAKDVIIFKYENPRFFKLMNIFAYCQFIFWSYLAHFAYTELRNVPVDEDVVADEESSWWQKLNLGEDKYRIGMTVFSLGVGAYMADICVLTDSNCVYLRVFLAPKATSSCRWPGCTRCAPSASWCCARAAKPSPWSRTGRSGATA